MEEVARGRIGRERLVRVLEDRRREMGVDEVGRPELGPGSGWLDILTPDRCGGVENVMMAVEWMG